MKNDLNSNKEHTQADPAKASETPFFARFLEGQHAEARPEAANDEAVIQTLKYPSDRDEWDPLT